MAKKYYAVKSGRKTGIFETWSECKAQVDGYKSAIYKSFLSLSDAEAYMGISGGPDKKLSSPDAPSEETDENTAVAYVDGSYKHETREFSCGAVLFYRGKEYYFSKKFDNKDMADMRNVAGEIMGSVSVISYCISNNIPNLVIYHDYEGVARWATGEWKANKKGTKSYKDFCDSSRDKLNFSFVKVKGHSGDKYNDMADALAKKALGIS